MFISSSTSRSPFGGSGPTGEWVKAGVVRLRAVGAVEAEVRREVRVDSRLVLAGELLLADLDQALDAFVSAGHFDRLLRSRA